MHPSWPYCYLLMLVWLMQQSCGGTISTLRHHVNGEAMVHSRLLPSRLLAIRLAASGPISHVESSNGKVLPVFPSPATFEDELQRIPRPISVERAFTVETVEELRTAKCLERLYLCEKIPEKDGYEFIHMCSVGAVEPICDSDTFDRARQFHLDSTRPVVNSPPSTKELIFPRPPQESSSATLKAMESFVYSQPMVQTPTIRHGFSLILHDLNNIQPLSPSEALAEIERELREAALPSSFPSEVNHQLIHEVTAFLGQRLNLNHTSSAPIRPPPHRAVLARPSELQPILPRSCRTNEFDYLYSDLTYEILERFLQPQTIVFLNEIQHQRHPNGWDYIKGRQRYYTPVRWFVHMLSHAQSDWTLTTYPKPRQRPCLS